MEINLFELDWFRTAKSDTTGKLVCPQCESVKFYINLNSEGCSSVCCKCNQIIILTIKGI